MFSRKFVIKSALFVWAPSSHVWRRNVSSGKMRSCKTIRWESLVKIKETYFLWGSAVGVDRWQCLRRLMVYKFDNVAKGTKNVLWKQKQDIPQRRFFLSTVKKTWRHLTPVCNLSSRGEFRPQLPTRATTFLDYSAKLGSQSVSGGRNITTPMYSAEWKLSGSEYKRLCGSKTRGCMGPEKNAILAPVWVQVTRVFWSKKDGNVGPWQGSGWAQGKRLYGSCWGRNMGPSVSLREENVSVQKRGEFGPMTRECVSARKDDVWVLRKT